MLEKDESPNRWKTENNKFSARRIRKKNEMNNKNDDDYYMELC